MLHKIKLILCSNNQARKSILCILSYFWLFPVLLSAQDTITGIVCNHDTKERLAYVSIGVLEKDFGTVSDLHGRFYLKKSENILSTDSVIFSNIGFKVKKYTVADLDNCDTIFLMPVTYELPEVVVKKSKTRERILGRDISSSGLLHVNFYSIHDNPKESFSRERGILVKVNNSCIINTLNFQIGSNNSDTVKFRLNFYTVENDLPKDILVNKDIIFEVINKRKGWFSLDLRPYYIFIEGGQKVAVTLTLLDENTKEKKRRYFSFAGAFTLNSTLYFREKAMSSWKVTKGAAISFYLDATFYLNQ